MLGTGPGYVLDRNETSRVLFVGPKLEPRRVTVDGTTEPFRVHNPREGKTKSPACEGATHKITCSVHTQRPPLATTDSQCRTTAVITGAAYPNDVDAKLATVAVIPATTTRTGPKVPVPGGVRARRVVELHHTVVRAMLPKKAAFWEHVALNRVPEGGNPNKGEGGGRNNEVAPTQVPWSSTNPSTTRQALPMARDLLEVPTIGLHARKASNL
jgi:hypothetical protein